MQRPHMQTPGVGHGGEKSLDYFDDKTPPGWMPGIPQYPWVQYVKKLELWTLRYRMAGHPTDQEAPAIASRLHGAAWEIAMKLKIPKTVQQGGPRPGLEASASAPEMFWTGGQALIQPEVREERHQVTNAVIQDRIPSGVQALFQAFEKTIWIGL